MCLPYRLALRCAAQSSKVNTCWATHTEIVRVAHVAGPANFAVRDKFAVLTAFEAANANLLTETVAASNRAWIQETYKHDRTVRR